MNSQIETWCDEPMPKNMAWISSSVIGCNDCNYKNAYFECACELAHDCNEWVLNGD